ncbi:MAG: hypothetical protein ACNA8R_12375 [Nitriliruptoraceae bacterium]
MEPQDMERLEALLSGVAFRHLEGLLAVREDALVAMLGDDLRSRWALEVGGGSIAAVWPGLDDGIDARQALVSRDLSRFEAAMEVARRGESVEFRGAARAAGGKQARIRTVLWAAEDGSGVVTVTTVDELVDPEPEGEAPAS